MTWNERKIRVGTMAIWVLWTVGAGLIALTCFALLAHPYAALGVAFVAWGCTIQIGCWMKELAHRERNAFDLGRDSVRQMRDR